MSIGACEEEPAVRYVTPRVEVAPYFDAPVCRGTLDDLERVARSIEETTGLRRSDRIRFNWGIEGLAMCSERSGGCALSEEGIVFGTLSVAPHEFAHAIGAVLGRSQLLVEEGFASNLGGPCVGGSDRSLSLLPSEAYLVAEEPEFTATGGRGVANSFATYLIGRFGRDAFQALKVRTPYGTPIEAFEDAVREIYGMSLTELEQAWAQHAPLESCGDGLPWGWDESAPHAYMFAPLTLSADLDCDDLGTKGPIDPRVVLGHATPQPVLPGMYADFDVIVPFASRVRVSLEGPPDATAYLRSGRCWDDFRDGASGTREPDALAGGEAMTLLLGGCLWHVALAASDDEPTAVSLRIEPVADG